MLLPTAGEVTVDGIDVARHPHEIRRRIGFLPDAPPLYGEMTVGRYLTFAAELRGVPSGEAARAVAEAEEKTATRDVHDELICSLSHGYRQRVGVAQALVHKPKLLILDEPTSGLDPVQIVEMRATIRGLRGEHTILLSSHILSEISQTCDRLLVIQRRRDRRPGHRGRIWRRRWAAAARSRSRSRRRRRAPSRSPARSPESAPAAVIRESGGVALVSLEGAPELRPRWPGRWSATGSTCCASIAAPARLESIFLKLTKDDKPGLPQ